MFYYPVSEGKQYLWPPTVEEQQGGLLSSKARLGRRDERSLLHASPFVRRRLSAFAATTTFARFFVLRRVCG